MAGSTPSSDGSSASRTSLYGKSQAPFAWSYVNAETRPSPASSLSDLMGRSEKRGRRAQFFTDFKRIVMLFAQKYGEKRGVFPLFAADLVKSDRLLGK